MKTLDHIKSIVKDHKLVFLSLSKPNCKICETLKPKVERALKLFPNLKVIFVDLDQIPDAVKEYNVSNLPTIILYAMGKEVYRIDRGHDPNVLKEEVEKYDKILFG